MKSSRVAEFVLFGDTGHLGWFKINDRTEVVVASKEAAMAFIREAGACGTCFPREEQEKLEVEVSKATRMPMYESEVSEQVRHIVKKMNASNDALKIKSLNKKISV